MTAEERGAWTFGIVTVIAYVVYATHILTASPAGLALADRAFMWPMIWTVVASIVINIVLTIIATIVTRSVDEKPDVRDKQISRMGDHAGYAFLAIAAVGAMVLAMLEAPYFWIANAIFLGFFVAGVVSAIARATAYRRGMPW